MLANDFRIGDVMIYSFSQVLAQAPVLYSIKYFSIGAHHKTFFKKKEFMYRLYEYQIIGNYGATEPAVNTAVTPITGNKKTINSNITTAA